MTTQPQQIDEARAVMRGNVVHLRHNRRREDAILADINRTIMRRRVSWFERLRGSLADALAARRARR